MRIYLLPENGNFYKANLHCHSNVSDGKLSPAQLKEIYTKKGYSIIAYTDHDVLIPHDDLTDENFLALHGVEFEVNEVKEKAPYGLRKCCHVCFIGIEPDNITQPMWHRSAYVWGNALNYREQVKFDDALPDYGRRFSGEGVSEMMQIARDKGFFVTYNHPAWSKEDYRDYTAYNGMHAFEMFNGGCIAAGFEDYNNRVYDDMLVAGRKIYCIGADDNHNHAPEDTRHFDSFYAFTMIKAESLDYRAVTKALEDGNFYASEGPEIYELYLEDGKVHIKCSDADRITCNYYVRNAEVVYDETGEGINEASFAVKPEQGYFRITVIDKQGKHACTNAYFIEDYIKNEQ